MYDLRVKAAAGADAPQGAMLARLDRLSDRVWCSLTPRNASACRRRSMRRRRGGPFSSLDGSSVSTRAMADRRINAVWVDSRRRARAVHRPRSRRGRPRAQLRVLLRPAGHRQRQRRRPTPPVHWHRPEPRVLLHHVRGGGSLRPGELRGSVRAARDRPGAVRAGRPSQRPRGSPPARRRRRGDRPCRWSGPSTTAGWR